MVEERHRTGEERRHNRLGQPRHLPRWLQALEGELFRKTFHLSSYAYALLLYLLSDPLFTWASVLYVAALDYFRVLLPEYARLYDLLEGITGRFIKDRERREVSDATFMTLGVALSVSLFGKYALLGLAISIPGDALASLTGKSIGGPKVLNGKTLTGFLAFVVWGGVVGLILDAPLDFLLLGAAVGAVEMFLVKWENLVLALWASLLALLLFYPTLV